jgi:hypothetical protein
MISTQPAVNGTDLHLGRNGSVVFIGADFDLAGEMRRAAFPAVCYLREAKRVKDAVERRAAVVAYFHPQTESAAYSAASWIERNCHAERVGTLYLGEMGFLGPADVFVSWWEEATCNGHYEDGSVFLEQADLRARWRDRSPITFDIAGDDDDEGPGPIEDAGVDAELAKYPKTDTGNAERMVARFGEATRYCHPWKKFLSYDGLRWVLDDPAIIHQLAEDIARDARRGQDDR